MVKKMNKVLNIILFSSFTIILNGQNVVNDHNKYEFLIQTGVFYKTFFSNKYIEPLTSNKGNNFKAHQYERFNKTDTWGYNAGLNYSFTSTKYWGISVGMHYFLRKDIFKNSIDTVIKYGNGSNIRDIHNIIEYNYSYNNIELSLLLKYTIEKFTVSTGCNLSLLSYQKAQYTYVVYQYNNAKQWDTDNKTIFGLVRPLKIFPTIQTSYKINFDEFKLYPYIALYYALNNYNSIFIQSGINIAIF